MKIDKDDIRKALDAATPGNWFVMHDTDIEVENPPGSGYTDSVGYTSSVNDAHLIANAPTWLRFLLDENERITKDNQRLRFLVTFSGTDEEKEADV